MTASAPDPSYQLSPQRIFELAIKDADDESMDNLEATGEMYDNLVLLHKHDYRITMWRGYFGSVRIEITCHRSGCPKRTLTPREAEEVLNEALDHLLVPAEEEEQGA
jgi:hypothetical protein